MKQLTKNGEFCHSNNTRYAINIPKDIGRELSEFESACFQIYKRVPVKDALSDAYRHLLISKPKSQNNGRFFYLPTMCAIGAMTGLFSKNEAINVERIVNAVAEKNEFWDAAIKRFNGFFETDSDSYLRGASRAAGGRLIIACVMTGLQIVCDLIKESRNLALAGKYIDAAEIDNLLDKMGLLNLHAYLLLLSPDHPECKILSDALDEYENKYELCVDSDEQWVLVSIRDIKKVSFMGVGTNNALPHNNDHYVVVEEDAATPVDESTDYQSDNDSESTEEFDVTQEGDSDTATQDDGNHQAENLEAVVPEIAAEPEPEPEPVPVIAQNQYSAKKSRKTPPGLTNGEDKLSGAGAEPQKEPQKSGFSAKKPSNVEDIPFEIGDM
ncbi:hypothetical protein [Psychrobacter sp. AOP31-A1-22]|uniref:hypothetical protein n=1 Tax=Psychrobacter sp. AOP31-A1-22 TaxID=3457696 RepID=UPI0040355536